MAKRLNILFLVAIAIPMRITIGTVNTGSTMDILFQVTRSFEKGQKS